MPLVQRVLVAGAVLAALLQLGAWGRGELRLWSAAGATAKLFDTSLPTPRRSAIDIHCARSLPPLAAQIPRDARVLLVTDALGPGSFDFHFIPRPFRYLQSFDPAWIAAAEAQDPALGALPRSYLARLEADDALLTPERLERDLAWADWLVALAASVDPPAGVRLEPVATCELATLYRIRR